jgi:hypothetical protein
VPAQSDADPTNPDHEPELVRGGVQQAAGGPKRRGIDLFGPTRPWAVRPVNKYNGNLFY